MGDNESADIRRQLLQWVQPIILILLLLVCILALTTNAVGSYQWKTYPPLIAGLMAIDLVAWYFTCKRKFLVSTLLTVSIALLGSWGSILIDAQQGITEFFPLIYVTITVILSSVSLPLLYTLVIASLQFVLLSLIVFSTPALMARNWASFLSYVLMVSALSMVANYIRTRQVRMFMESSIRDHLTGLLNRRYFDATLEDRVKRGSEKNISYGIMLMDIDNFKRYNDNFSHATGDTILQRIGSFLSGEMERNSIVCRYGGDEFAIILPDTNKNELFMIADKIRLDVKDLDISDICPNYPQLSLSIGLVLFPEDESTSEDLMAHADRYLMIAKEQGKDRVMSR